MPATQYYTADMARALIDERRPSTRYEVVYGELLVSPGPRPWHQEIVARLFIALRTYLEREPAGHVLMAPADISWGEDTLVQPDVFVFPIEEVRPLDWRRMKTMLLCAEVVSPSTQRADRFTKRRLYQDRRVPLYWVIDADRQRVETWRPHLTFPEFEETALTWHPDRAVSPFVMTLEELFRPL